MLRIWGRLSSINVQKVVWCARELHLDHERVDIGVNKGDLDTEAYVRLNPNRQIPVIEDFRGTDVGGEPFVLWESNAIVRYLCARYGEGTLWPEDVKARASADRWMDWQTTAFSPAMVTAFLNLVRKSADERDEAAIQASCVRTEPLADLLDKALAGREFIGGDRFTMADISLACAAHRWMGLPRQHQPRPNLERWLSAMRARPAAGGILELPLR
ncbi:glutathione S-transferase family protein [Cupriavidus oxalaticus]|jgi:glutathione S-transferase|uniref:Glutathione S transferase n=1 Tax=Cupriavidus oxalaticus TaxID=96344 RepID=A0A375G1R2_9BURK|nr:glutathione S-transferase family protein [Cupriavidus oxalaticus]QRQ88369.1 glutathione S-transferase family protein [Cupriavidus oxalaticus]QRQ93304.1 glutathione S-transferase family protein [Cupriavidus oxalaticus]WQD81921.1 glutathione S-transferase family protein [Cupriavidus oxalaticus]SPC13304.1 putative Glutathione S transferase [Cupriavidus oxalaticus]